ncbi:MAG TPA: translation elongation factor Ts [Bacteroidota bacterium]|nr:translation elongation factor Ts [Bacteroidota bacterium]
MAISSETVKNLREKTGAGMMDCKRALEATSGDMEKAVEYLRKKGAATAEKRADRVANQGIVVTKVGEGGKLGVIVEINSETDFVARSQDFIQFANDVTAIVEKERPASIEALLGLEYGPGRKVSDALSDLIGKIGEKIAIRRFDIIVADKSVIEAYTHMGSKIGVLVELATSTQSAEAKTVARDVAMQTAAMSPAVVAREHVAKDVVEHELDIYRQQAKNEGKPDQVVDRIATGRLEKYYQDVVLLEQSFIKDASKTIKDVLHETSTKLNDTLTIRQFRRYQLGDEK